MKTRIETNRIILRPLIMDDADNIAAGANDKEVARWLCSLPHPYVLADAEGFILSQEDRPFTKGIEFEGRIIGCISLKENNELGYWIARRYWRQGLMSEAVEAFLNAYFDASNDTVCAYYLLGNDTSGHILSKLGFLQNDLRKVDTLNCGQVSAQYMTLTKTRWAEVASALQGTAQSTNAA